MNTMNNQKKHKRLWLIPVVLLLLSCALGVFRFQLLINFMDNATGLYTDLRVGNLFGGLTLALFLLCFVAGWTVKKLDFSRPIKNEALTVAFASSVCALMMVAILATGVYDVIKGLRTPSVFFVLEILFCILSIVYFYLVCSKGVHADADKMITFGLWPLAPALYAAIRTITLFMNTENQINASQRSFVLLTLICIMMFFVAEAEFGVPCAKTDAAATQKRMSRLASRYFAYGLAASCLVIVVIITYALAQAFWIYDKTNLLYNLMDLCFGLYALVRVFSIG